MKKLYVEIRVICPKCGKVHYEVIESSRLTVTTKVSDCIHEFKLYEAKYETVRYMRKGDLK